MMDHAFILAYIGPETMLPLGSVAGSIVGILLMFWHRIVSWGKSARSRLTRTKPAAAPCQAEERS